MMQEKSFETMMNELEELVKNLESGETELDKALGMYRDGVAIIKELNGRLEKARKQIKIVGEEENEDE